LNYHAEYSVSQTSKHADCFTNVLLESHHNRKKTGS